MSEEIWRDIEGYDGKYQISNLGRVRSFKHSKPRILRTDFLRNGYLQVTLQNRGVIQRSTIHRLVAKAFIPNLENKPAVNHINGIKTDNRVENLEWVTHRENSRHAIEIGIGLAGERNGRAKITNEQARYIRENPDGLTCVELGKLFGLSKTSISAIQLGVTFKNAGGTIRTQHLDYPQRLPDTVRKQIRAEYKPHTRGHGCTSLAKKFGCGETTVRRILDEE